MSGQNIASRTARFCLNAMRDGARDHDDAIADDVAQQMRIVGIEAMIFALLDQKISDSKTLTSMLQKYWNMTFNDANTAVHTIKTIEYPVKQLVEYLDYHGYSNGEICQYKKHAYLLLKHSPNPLWKLTPAKLKKEIDKDTAA